ncbi:MAG: ISL3 family transposase ISAtc2 [Planctomycetes bacterium]|nr:ISL3 family transposase ISAtc2 [Planctomycetota bacterium]
MDTTKLFEAALGLKSPWRVAGLEFQAGARGGRGRLDIRLDFERGGALPCPECSKPCKAHDTDEQTWRHLNFFEHEAYLVARTPRVNCEVHGVLKVEVPWARPGSGFTLLFEAYVMALAPEMPMAALARMVGEHDTRLWRIVKRHVEEARRQVDMSEVRSVVVDETSRAKHHSYVSLFLEPKQLDEEGEVRQDARVLFATEGRASGTFHAFVSDLQTHGGKATNVRDVCMDMSPAYQLGASEALPWAAVTFDRFHVMKLVSFAVDQARRREGAGRLELRRSRFLWLKNPSTLSSPQRETIERLSTTNLLTAKAYQMRLNLQGLWDRRKPERAAAYLRRWCSWVLRVAKRPADPETPWVLETMHKTALTLRDNAQGILNYFRLRMTSGVIESVNSLAQAARARARGYRNADTFITMIYLIAGRLRFDLPALTHSP